MENFSSRFLPENNLRILRVQEFNILEKCIFSSGYLEINWFTSWARFQVYHISCEICENSVFN